MAVSRVCIPGQVKVPALPPSRQMGQVMLVGFVIDIEQDRGIVA